MSENQKIIMVGFYFPVCVYMGVYGTYNNIRVMRDAST